MLMLAKVKNFQGVMKLFVKRRSNREENIKKRREKEYRLYSLFTSVFYIIT
jgi:hypothetical protein